MSERTLRGTQFVCSFETSVTMRDALNFNSKKKSRKCSEMFYFNQIKNDSRFTVLKKLSNRF